MLNRLARSMSIRLPSFGRHMRRSAGLILNGSSSTSRYDDVASEVLSPQWAGPSCRGYLRRHLLPIPQQNTPDTKLTTFYLRPNRPLDWGDSDSIYDNDSESFTLDVRLLSDSHTALRRLFASQSAPAFPLYAADSGRMGLPRSRDRICFAFA